MRISPPLPPARGPRCTRCCRTLRGSSSTTEVKKAYKESGLNKLYMAFDPAYVPKVNPVTIAPQDTLHLFADGLLRSEGAWLLYVLGKHGLSISKLNARKRAYAGFPRDVRIPDFHVKVFLGRVDGCPKSDSILRMTGSQCHWWTLHR